MVLRRQDVQFTDKEQALRKDVRTLGAMVGDLIREQGGEELFDFVETARLRSIRRREGNEKPGDELAALVRDLDPVFALSVIRSFSTYFQMVNTAEKVHRIRRRLLSRLEKDGIRRPGARVGVAHVGAEDAAKSFVAELGETFDIDTRGISITTVSPVLSAHCGPGTIGVAILPPE